MSSFLKVLVGILAISENYLKVIGDKVLRNAENERIFLESRL